MGNRGNSFGLAVDSAKNNSLTSFNTQDLTMPSRTDDAGSFPASPPPSSSRTSRNRSISEYSQSVAGSEGARRNEKSAKRNAKQKDGKGRWLSHVKDWFSTGEPSAHDWKQFKKEEYKRRGIEIGDPEAQAKMHAPIGQIPKGAIKPSGGPDPAKMAKKRAEGKSSRQSFGNPPKTSQSISSGSSSSLKDRNIIAPWTS